jgi:hypothetical protein
MLQKLFSATVWGIALCVVFLACACSTSSTFSSGIHPQTAQVVEASAHSVRPTPGTPKDQLTPDQITEYSDQKGHFHPEWVGEPGH